MVKIGVPLRYSHLEDKRCILYLGERVRRTFQNAGAMVFPIVQVHDTDYADTKFDQFQELRDVQKYIVKTLIRSKMFDRYRFNGTFQLLFDGTGLSNHNYNLNAIV